MSPSFPLLFVGLFEQEIVLKPSKSPFLKYISTYRRGNLDFYFPHLPIMTWEGFDHHAHGPVVLLDMTVLQEHKVPFLQIRSL
eukprot:superscaffoldBa00000507_g5289